jgi:APA family basic amino acid/polyamine antiporter
VARKLPQLQRVLDAPALFSVAYGEIASSIYFALGVVALYALGLTPLVLLVAGAIFLLVSLSYAEGTAAIRETGGAATFVRRASNDLTGFITGWALFLDYLIVIALSALTVPHYLGAAFGIDRFRQERWDVAFGVLLILAIAAVRLIRRSRLYTFALLVALLDLVTQLMLVTLGVALVLSPDVLTRGMDLGTAPTWHDLAFALPLAFLAYTGLETVANFAEETRRPGRDLPRSLFSAIAVVVLVYVAIAWVALSAFPPENGRTALGDQWLEAPLLGVVDQLGRELPSPLGDALEVYVGLTAALVLIAAATTSISGFGRLAYSLGEHRMLPRAFGRLHRRTLVSPSAIVAAAVISSLLLIGTTVVRPHDEVASLASLFSFGVLLAFTAAQVAVVRLRLTEPDLPRPFRVPFGFRLAWAEIPIPSLVGVLLTLTIWIVALATHPGARYAGPVWLALGVVVFVAVRLSLGQPLLHSAEASAERSIRDTTYSRVLVPMKTGPIGDEMVLTAVKLAQGGADVLALFVIQVPLDQELDADLDGADARAAASLTEAKELAADHRVDVEGCVVRSRSIGKAIVEEAERVGADVVVLGSHPRWRRQSRFFSPTVDYVLRNAVCEVVIVAFPQGALEDEAVETAEATLAR